ncbi:MAG: PIN domain-containing protein [Desulfobacteraceae bacterium]|nr:PIN domain-containing protein [Desulfobacteraceae bacterium]
MKRGFWGPHPRPNKRPNITQWSYKTLFPHGFADPGEIKPEKEAAGGRALLSTQILQEFYVAVTRKLEVPLPAEKAEEIVGQFKVLPLVEISSSHILKAIWKSIRLQFSFRDALIIEAALSGRASILYTEDLQRGQTIDNLKILYPFRK